MEKPKRLSLDEIKAKANQSSRMQNLEAIKGGNLSDCHGFWGRVGKSLGLYTSEGAFSEQ